MRKFFGRIMILLSLLLCAGCSSNNNEVQYEEKEETEETVSIISETELENILQSNMSDLIENQNFQISKDKFVRVFAPEYYPCAVAENSDFYLVCTSYYNENLPPAYIVFNEEPAERYLEQLGLNEKMNFSDIMKVWGNSDIFETSYDTVQKKYKIEYERDGLRFLFISEEESGTNFVLYIALPKDGLEEEIYYPIPSDDEIKSCLNKSVQELEKTTECEIEKMLSILPFPVLYSRNTSYWFVCGSWDTACKPIYLVFYEESEEEYLCQLGLKNADDFSDIIEVMGDTEVVVSRTSDEMEEIKDRVGDCTYYKIEYEVDGLQYAFIADNVNGENFTLYIGLAASDEVDISEEPVERDDAEQAMVLYEE